MPQGVYDKKYLASDELLQNLSRAQGHSDKQISLRSVYTPLEVNPLGHENKPDEQEQKQPYTALRAVSEKPLSVLKGDPGCGKTTFTRYWALRLAEDLLKAKPDLRENNMEEALPLVFANAFPVHMELSKLYRFLPEAKQAQGKPSPGDIREAINQYFAHEFVGLEKLQQLEGKAFKDLSIVWLFDGLDEIYIDDAARKHFLGALHRWLGQNKPIAQRVCLSSRPYAYERDKMPGFTELSVQPLSHKARFHYISALFSALKTQGLPSQHPAEKLVDLLLREDKTSLLDLCGNPLLLSLTTTLYYDQGEEALLDDRAGLYELCVEKILQRWEDKRDQSDARLITLLGSTTVLRSDVHQALNKLAYFAHLNLSEGDKEKRNHGDVSEVLLQQYFFSFFKVEQDEAKEIKEYLSCHTGILFSKDDKKYGFVHRSLREFLAARFLAENNELSLLTGFIQAFYQDPGWWREVLALCAKQSDKLTLDNNTGIGANKLLHLCLPYALSEVPEEEYRDFCEQVFACAYAEQERLVAQAPGPLQAERFTQRLRQWLLALMASQALTIHHKAQAARYLGWLGDPRPGTGCIQLKDKTWLPAFEWAEIPKGKVTLDTTLDTNPEKVAKTFEIAQPFKMAIYPVTNRQFQAFLKHPQGYENKRWWQGKELSEEGLQEIMDHSRHPCWQEPNHPRVDVSWYAARAFCRWLTAMYQERGLIEEVHCIRLPAEWEWQQAGCSGDAKRVYPWEGSEYKTGYANINEGQEQDGDQERSYLGRTSAVGLFGKGKSEQGVFDLAGNVWEWCSNNRHSLNIDESDEAKAIRGGAWHGHSYFARASFRYDYHPNYRSSNVGFRVLCAPTCLPAWQGLSNSFWPITVCQGFCQADKWRGLVLSKGNLLWGA